MTAERDHLPCTLFGLREAGFDSLVLLGPRVDDLVSMAEPQGWRAAPGPPGRFTRLVQARVPAPATTPACPPDLGR